MEPFVYVVYDPGDIVTASYRVGVVPDNVKSCKNAQQLIFVHIVVPTSGQARGFAIDLLQYYFILS